MGACALLLQACAVPVPLKIASWALDGISYLATQKSLTDHGLSVVAQQDCALLRGLQGEEICKQGGAEPDGSVLAAVDVAPAPEAIEPTADSVAAAPRADEATAAPWSPPVAAAEAAPADFVTAAGGSDVVAPAAPEMPAAVKTEPWGDIYYVVASFREIERADVVLKRFPHLELRVLTGSLDGSDVYRVAAGPFRSGEGVSVRRMIRKAGLSNAWAVRMPASRWTVARGPGTDGQLASAEAVVEPSRVE